MLLAFSGGLELVEADSTSIAKAFRACVELRPWIEEDAERLDMLGTLTESERTARMCNCLGFE